MPVVRRGDGAVIALSTLGWGLVLIIAVLAIGLGLLTMFAGGMSDSPGEGRHKGKQGGAMVVVALIVGGLAIWRLFA